MKVILGGGISGLASGYYLRRNFPNMKILLYESLNQTGGWIRSKKLPNGAIFEQGPRTLRPKGEAGFNTLQLIDDLALSEKILSITSNHPAAKNRMIYVNGKLYTLPSSLQQIFKTTPPFSKPIFQYLVQDLSAKRKTLDANDESIYSFVKRRFGEDIAKYAISPLICGICAGNAKEISVKFLMKSLFDSEQKYGGVIKGMVYGLFNSSDIQKLNIEPNSLADIAKKEKWSVYSLQGGLETLVNQLNTNLTNNGVDVILNKRVEKLTFVDDNVLLTVDGYEQENIGKHVISCLPASNLADLVQEQHPQLAEHLKQIQAVNVGVVNLYYKEKVHNHEAFGFLVPPCENVPILGVIFDSCCFSDHKCEDCTVLTVMMGGHWFENLFGKNPTEEQLLNTAIEQIREILNIKQPPDMSNVNILRNCIPQYVVGHYDRINKIENYIREQRLPLSICGSSYYGVGVNDVILSAKKAVNSIKTT